MFHTYNNAALNAANAEVFHARLNDILQFTPDKINHLRRGGIRQGAGRTTAEMQQLLDKIPPSQRSGLDRESAAYQVREYLSNKDASHIQSHNHGGSNYPDNIKWEHRSLNRSRGDRNMNRREQKNLRIQALSDLFQYEEALKALEEAIAINPSNDEYLKLKRELTK